MLYYSTILHLLITSSSILLKNISEDRTVCVLSSEIFFIGTFNKVFQLVQCVNKTNIKRGFDVKREKVCVQNVTYQYPSSEEEALKGVSFSLYENEWLAILGQNGSGKSTLGKLLNGMQLPKSGEIKVEGYQLALENIWEIRKRVGMVFQNPDNQFVGATVLDDIAFGMENLAIPRDEMIKRSEKVLQQVQMSKFKNSEPHLLSGGQKQRVAIAGILAMQPSVLVLDEATSMLDPKGTKEVLNTVSDLMKSERLSVISITHDLEELTFADRVIVLNNGEILYEGTPDNLFEKEQMLREIGLDVPFSVKVTHELRKNGIILEEKHEAMESLVEELWKLYSKN